MYYFRERKHRLDWHVVDSIDLDSIILMSDNKALASRLYEFTFAALGPNDVEDPLIMKFIHFLQYSMEYMLHIRDLDSQDMTSIEGELSNMQQYVK